jgi:hypothetical protein
VLLWGISQTEEKTENGTIETLGSDTHSYQYAGQTIEEINTLSAGGIKINTTPSHVDI